MLIDLNTWSSLGNGVWEAYGTLEPLRGTALMGEAYYWGQALIVYSLTSILCSLSVSCVWMEM